MLLPPVGRVALVMFAGSPGLSQMVGTVLMVPPVTGVSTLNSITLELTVAHAPEDAVLRMKRFDVIDEGSNILLFVPIFVTPAVNPELVADCH